MKKKILIFLNKPNFNPGEELPCKSLGEEKHYMRRGNQLPVEIIIDLNVNGFYWLFLQNNALNNTLWFKANSSYRSYQRFGM